MPTKTVQVYGVVDSGGGGGGGRGNHCFRDVQFVKWRPVGGEISNTPLYVRELCKDEEVRPWMKSLNAGCMLHMEIKFTKQMTPEQFRGEIIRNFGKTRADKELLLATKDKRPKKINVAKVGEFKLDARHDCYSASVAVGAKKVDLQINSTSQSKIESVCQQLAEKGVLKPTFQKSVLDILVQDMIELKNKTWLEPNEKPISQAAFRKAVRLTAIEVWPNGRFEFVYDDGDLFQGHDLVVRGSLKSGPKSADLYG